MEQELILIQVTMLHLPIVNCLIILQKLQQEEDYT